MSSRGFACSFAGTSDPGVQSRYGLSSDNRVDWGFLPWLSSLIWRDIQKVLLRCPSFLNPSVQAFKTRADELHLSFVCCLWWHSVQHHTIPSSSSATFKWLPAHHRCGASSLSTLASRVSFDQAVEHWSAAACLSRHEDGRDPMKLDPHGYPPQYLEAQS